AKNLRASYAAIAIYLFCPWEKSTNQFISERLGHVSDATATNYEDYQVCDKEGKPMTRGAWLERLNEEIIKPTENHIVNTRIRISEAAKNTI
ncbi:MAG: protelomerase family protein, partial [Nostoc sp.]